MSDPIRFDRVDIDSALFETGSDAYFAVGRNCIARESLVYYR
nr:hypothetical protein [Natrinema salinisoli]